MIEVSYGIGVTYCGFCGGIAGYVHLTRDLYVRIARGEDIRAVVFCNDACQIASLTRLDERVNEMQA